MFQTCHRWGFFSNKASEKTYWEILPAEVGKINYEDGEKSRKGREEVSVVFARRYCCQKKAMVEQAQGY